MFLCWGAHGIGLSAGMDLHSGNEVLLTYCSSDSKRLNYIKLHLVDKDDFIRYNMFVIGCIVVLS